MPGEAKDFFATISTSASSLRRMGPGFEAKVEDFADTDYGKGLGEFRNTLAAEIQSLGLEAKPVVTTLEKIEFEAAKAYENAVKMPGFKWDEAKWAGYFTEAKTQLDSLAAAADPAKAAEIQKLVADKKQELDEFQKAKYNEAMHALDRTLDSQRKTNYTASINLERALKDAAEWGYDKWAKSYTKVLFKPTDTSLTEEDLKKESHMPFLKTADKDGLRREMKKLQESNGRLFEGQTPPYEGRMFEYSKQGCRPQPPAKYYREEYGGALELLRFKHPGCAAIFAIPQITEIYEQKDRPTLDFLNADYIKKKIIPVFQEAENRGIPIKLDSDLRAYLYTLLAEERQNRWEIKKAIFGEKSNLEMAIEDLFALETQMQSRAVRRAMVGKDSKQMTEKVQKATRELELQQHLDLEAKHLSKRNEVEGLLKNPAIASVPQAKPSSPEEKAKIAEEKEKKIEEGALRRLLETTLGADYEKKDTTPEQKEIIIRQQLEAIEKYRQTAAETNELSVHQLAAMGEKVKGEDKDERKDVVQKRDEFLDENGHILKLEELANLQRTKLVELELKTKVVQQAIKDLAAGPPPRDMKQVMGEADKCKQKISNTLAENKAQTFGVQEYKVQRKADNDLKEKKAQGLVR